MNFLNKTKRIFKFPFTTCSGFIMRFIMPIVRRNRREMSSESVKPTLPTLQERYEACMLLHAVGDAMGYKNGKWEFTFSGRDIHDQLTQLGGVENLNLDPKDWRVSDDTILHLAVAECLISTSDWSPGEKVWNSLIDNYKYAMTDMNGRAPGSTTQTSIHDLSKIREKGYQIPFNIRGGGCGASMRSSCIGLRYAEEDQKENLVAFAIESGRMTHHHPIGYLGALAAALFTSYAIQGHPITSWGVKFIEDLSLAQKYVEETNHSKEESLAAWNQVKRPWENYLKLRKIETGKENEASFPDKYGVEERDEFYKKITNSEWAGANGIDSVLIAYDGILGCKANWKELCLRAMLHGGDNDSTGCIAGSWFGALYGFDTVPKKNYESLEYKDRIKKIGNDLYDIHNKDLKTSKRSTE